MTWWEYGLAFVPSSFFEWTQVTMRDRGQDLCIHCVHTLSFLHSSLAFHLPFWAWICKCPAGHPLWILCPFWEISCYKAGKGLLCPECPNPIMRNKAETRNSLSKPTSPTPTFAATSWSILTIKKDLHANFTICLLVLFAKSFSTVA